MPKEHTKRRLVDVFRSDKGWHAQRGAREENLFRIDSFEDIEVVLVEDILAVVEEDSLVVVEGDILVVVGEACLVGEDILVVVEDCTYSLVSLVGAYLVGEGSLVVVVVEGDILVVGGTLAEEAFEFDKYLEGLVEGSFVVVEEDNLVEVVVVVVGDSLVEVVVVEDCKCS